jgi:hypothetical protein
MITMGWWIPISFPRLLRDDVMIWALQFEPDALLATLTVSGVAHVDGFREYLNGMLSNPAWVAGTAALLDFRALRLDHLSFPEVERIVELHVPHLNAIGRGPIAVVVSRPVDLASCGSGFLAADMFPAHRGVLRNGRSAALAAQAGCDENVGPGSPNGVPPCSNHARLRSPVRSRRRARARRGR